MPRQCIPALTHVHIPYTANSSRMQGPLLLLTMQLMHGGSLMQALQGPSSRQQLRWAERCDSGTVVEHEVTLWLLHIMQCAAQPSYDVAMCSLLVELPRLVNPRACICACRGCQVALDIAEALDYLHTQLGILHSDLKPA